MKNIQGTKKDLDLFNKDGVRVYAYRKCSDEYSYEYTYDSNGKALTYKSSSGYSYEYTRDSNGNIITYKDSDGLSSEYTYDSDGKELTYEDSNGLTRGFDKTYTPEEIEFMNRAVVDYWEIWTSEHPDNQKDWNLTQQILNK